MHYVHHMIQCAQGVGVDDFDHEWNDYIRKKFKQTITRHVAKAKNAHAAYVNTVELLQKSFGMWDELHMDVASESEMHQQDHNYTDIERGTLGIKLAVPSFFLKLTTRTCYEEIFIFLIEKWLTSRTSSLKMLEFHYLKDLL
jgi:hypothetical protein